MPTITGAYSYTVGATTCIAGKNNSASSVNMTGKVYVNGVLKSTSSAAAVAAGYYFALNTYGIVVNLAVGNVVSFKIYGSTEADYRFIGIFTSLGTLYAGSKGRYLTKITTRTANPSYTLGTPGSTTSSTIISCYLYNNNVTRSASDSGYDLFNASPNVAGGAFSTGTSSTAITSHASYCPYYRTVTGLASVEHRRLNIRGI